MFPKAALKSLHSKVLCSLPFTVRQPFILLSSLLTSSSVSLRAGMFASVDDGPASGGTTCGVRDIMRADACVRHRALPEGREPRLAAKNVIQHLSIEYLGMQ